MLSDQSLLTWVAVAFAVLVVLSVIAKGAQPKSRFERKRFLTENEARVLTLLEAALPQHRIMAQVAMGALLKTGGADKKRAHAARNRFAQKIVDFVVVTRDNAEVLALVELDDRTHRAAKDAERDAMTSTAGYRTIRIPSKPRPTPESVRAAVANVTTANPSDAAARSTEVRLAPSAN